MQRYPSASTNAGIGINSSVSGTTGRESVRPDASFQASSYAVNSRRQPHLAPYKLKCDKDSLNDRLGPPDYYPQTPNCLEETLTRDYLQSGYKETVDGIEEAREIVLSQIGFFEKAGVFKCKEAVRKKFREINDSRARRRKSGQVYGVALSGALLTKPGFYPEQRPCSEDFRRKWVEALSQPHKRLRSLSDHVPHGYRKKSLFDVLTRYNVPLLRATWFVKVNYLNQVRPASGNISTTSDKSQYTRSEQWCKDLIEYMQQLLDELCSKDGVLPLLSKEHPSPGFVASNSQVKQRSESSPAISDIAEPTVLFKWWYMVHLVQWHLAEGLLIPPLLIEWVLNQLQEKGLIEVFELLFPLVLALVNYMTLSQTYVRMFVESVIHRLTDVSSGDFDANIKLEKASLLSSLAEVLRYMIIAAPDSFVSLDCFPLPLSVAPEAHLRGSLLKIVGEEASHIEREVPLRYLSVGYAVSAIQKRASDLSKNVNPGLESHGAAKVVQYLDQALVTGNLEATYALLFEDLCDPLMARKWSAEVSPCLRSSMKWFGTIDSCLISSVFFLCEWATCDYRDFRSSCPQDVKLTGKKDISEILVAVSLLKIKMEALNGSLQSKSNSQLISNNNTKSTVLNAASVRTAGARSTVSVRCKARTGSGKKSKYHIFESPGPLHDIVVCWLDQHEFSSAAGFTRVEILISELIRSGIFYPQAYVRQLIVSGIMDSKDSSVGLDKKLRHHRILKQFPGSCLVSALEEAKIVEGDMLLEAVSIYSSERRLVLDGLSAGQSCKSEIQGLPSRSRKRHNHGSPAQDVRQEHVKARIVDVKDMLSSLLHFPSPCSILVESQDHVTANLKGSAKPAEYKVESEEAKLTCEESRGTKRQKMDEQSYAFQGIPLIQSDEDDFWWVRKLAKSQEFYKAEAPQKPLKNSIKSRQKVVRKTQSLAQLAAARIESSQEASTSHVCDSKMGCLNHNSTTDGENHKEFDLSKAVTLDDIGRSLKRLRLLERRSVSIWLLRSVRQLLEGSDTTNLKNSSCTSGTSQLDGRSIDRWKLGEDELMSILYVVDLCFDLVSAAKFLVWLLRKIRTVANTAAQGGRSIMQPRFRENQTFQVGETFILSSLQRYENVLLAADLLPEVLTAALNKNFGVVMPNGRYPSSTSSTFVRHLLRKYKDVPGVIRWEKNFRTSCDQRMIAELDHYRSVDFDSVASSGSLSVEDDDRVRHKLSGRVRPVPNMKEIVQRNVDEALRYLYGKERKISASLKTPSVERWEDSYQVAYEIVTGLVDCIRQNCGANPNGDPSVVASAVSAIVCNVGPALAKLPDFASCTYQGSSSGNPINLARHILSIHVTALCLIREVLGEQFSRVFEVALSMEALSAVSVAFSPPKVHRGQFQASPDAHDGYGNHLNEVLNNPGKSFIGKAGKHVAAVSALILSAIVHGVISLERMIAVFRLKEGLDVMQLLRSSKSAVNGASRSIGTEVYVHWFRVLIGSCRPLYDGLIADILGESYVVAISRMQRILPLGLVLPPAYSIFAMILWRRHIHNGNVIAREDLQLYQFCYVAFSGSIRHQPFRDVCFRNSHALYEFLAADTGDSDFAATVELHNLDRLSKAAAFIPLRARQFLNALVDCKMPAFPAVQDDGSWVSDPSETKANLENDGKLLERHLQILDTLQPAKFHWQWVELRLILNEQALIEKIASQKMSLAEALRSLSPNAENFTLSESEKGFTEIVLSRLLVRPDAASLYAEVVHLLGKLLQESLVVDIKWFLEGQDVLLGRKSVRQQLLSVAHRRGLPIKSQMWRPWGWSSSIASMKGTKRRLETPSIEEGEVVDEASDLKKAGRGHSGNTDTENPSSVYQYATEMALTELMFPCIDRSSGDLRNLFAGELIKQMGLIEQSISTAARQGVKQSSSISSGTEGAASKVSSRKAIRGGSPVIGRRPQIVSDSTPPSASALRASLHLRLQCLVRLLPVIFADREQSARSMRQTLAPILLRLLGTRMVYDDVELAISYFSANALKRNADSMDLSNGAMFEGLGVSLFDRLLCVFYALVGNCKPSWIKPKPVSKSTNKSPRDFSALDRATIEGMQSDLDRMELPAAIRRRIQAAMPCLPTSQPFTISCCPPQLSLHGISPLQAGMLPPGMLHRNALSNWVPTNLTSRSKAALPPLDPDMEIDPWTLLEDGTACSSTSAGASNMASSNSDPSNLKACSWLKGAVRLRRADLTYIGSLDDDS